MGRREKVASPEDIRQAVQGLIFEALARKKSSVRLEDIKEGVSLVKDLGVDSLDILQIVAMVEKRYRLRIPEEELRSLGDLGAIVRAVRRRLGAEA